MKRKLTTHLNKKVYFLFLCFAIAFNPFLSGEKGYVEPWGKDADLIQRSSSNIPPVPQKSSFATKAAEYVILFHQNIISPIDGPRSHFRPTSSRYMLLAMKRHGFFKGFVMGCDRLLRENKEEWVYRTHTIDGITYKWDPTFRKIYHQSKELQKKKKSTKITSSR